MSRYGPLVNRSGGHALARRIRSFLFLLSAAAVSGVFSILFPLYFVLPRHVSWFLITAYLRILLFLLKWICGLDYEVHGRENIPKTPCLFASQHQSLWENLFFQLLFDNPAFFVKKEIFGFPLVGSIARGNGHICTDRSGDIEMVRQAFRQAIATARSGRSIFIYPSGTRYREGDEPLKTGVAQLYAKLGFPCVPILLDTGRYWPNGWAPMRGGTIQIRVLPPIPPGLDRNDFRSTLAESLEEAG